MISTGGGTATTPLPRLENAQSQQNATAPQLRTDFNQISRSESLQQERVMSWTGGGGEVRETQQIHYFRNSNSYNNDNNIQQSNEGIQINNHSLHHQQQVLNRYRSMEHHHPVITGRSMSAPLADEEEEVEQGRRTTRDWGNSCYANVDCSTGCGRERFHNQQQQQQQQMQRRSVGSGGSTTMNVDVVVETMAGNRQSVGGTEMKTKMSGSQNNETSATVPMNGRTMAGLLARSRTPSFEKKIPTTATTTTAQGSQNNNINVINNSGNVLFIDSDTMPSTAQQSGGSSSVCYSRSEYELRKLRSSFRMRTAAAASLGTGRSVEEKSLRGEGKVVDRVRSLEGNGETASGQLMGFTRAELDYYQQTKRPKSGGYQQSYNYCRSGRKGEEEEDDELINVTGDGGEDGGNCQMDRLTAELNELFSGVERALRSVPLNDEEGEEEVEEEMVRKYSGDAQFDQREIGNEEHSPARNEVLEKSFSDMRLDLAARARLMQRQMSVDQDQSSVLSGFLSSMSRRDYLLDSPSMLMLNDNHNNKSGLGGGGSGNPLFDNSVYLNSSSNTGSAVSSLVNMDCSPSSPPQATSPTDEMRELLEQISQLQRGGEDEEVEQQQQGGDIDGRGTQEDVVAEEERIITRLRRDSERERSFTCEAVEDNEEQLGNPGTDWMLMMKKRNKSEGDNNSGAVQGAEEVERSITKTSHRNSNNKSTKRPLSFQNNSHARVGSLNLPFLVNVGGGEKSRGQYEEEDEEVVDPFNLHNSKAAQIKIGTSLNSTHSRCSNSRNSRDAAWEEGENEEDVDEGQEDRWSNYDRRPMNSFSSNRKPNKSFYIPVATHSPNSAAEDGGGVLRSPLERSARKILGAPSRVGGYSPTTTTGVGFLPGIMLLGQGRKFGRLSRSAPTTPGTVLPPNKFDDISPLLLDENEEEEHV